MKYKVMIGDKLYKITMSDGFDYRPKEDKDIIIYTVDEENQVINARIENPSQHTLYLISQGRCYLGINRKMTHKWSFYGSPAYREGQLYRLGQRERHPYWSKKDVFIKVTNLSSIQVPFDTSAASYQDVWYLNDMSDYKHNPQRSNYYVIFKPILISATPNFRDEVYIWNPNTRVYSTNSKETLLTIDR